MVITVLKNKMANPVEIN